MAKVKKKKFARRDLDRLATLKAYENRIRLLPDEEFNLIRVNHILLGSCST